jgi:hypothetical protein
MGEQQWEPRWESSGMTIMVPPVVKPRVIAGLVTAQNGDPPQYGRTAKYRTTVVGV